MANSPIELQDLKGDWTLFDGDIRSLVLSEHVEDAPRYSLPCSDAATARAGAGQERAVAGLHERRAAHRDRALVRRDAGRRGGLGGQLRRPGLDVVPARRAAIGPATPGVCRPLWRFPTPLEYLLLVHRQKSVCPMDVLWTYAPLVSGSVIYRFPCRWADVGVPRCAGGHLEHYQRGETAARHRQDAEPPGAATPRAASGGAVPALPAAAHGAAPAAGPPSPPPPPAPWRHLFMTPLEPGSGLLVEGRAGGAACWQCWPPRKWVS